ncbi:MAG: QueT transporter family protein [Clostridiales bacterium]|jgi:uncharacterized membrane protein|nr:QueT transporter family protein [Clostridiales bacterium]
MKTKKNVDVKAVALGGLTAAVYFAVTSFLAPISFGMIQFRMAEILNLMAFFHPAYAIGVTIGCFFSNLLLPSSFGLADVLIGTFCTGLSVLAVTKTKSLFLASLCPAVFNIPVAGVIAYYTEAPFVLTAGYVFLGQIAVVTVVGYPLFRFVILKNKALVNFISLGRNDRKGVYDGNAKLPEMQEGI